MKPIARQKTLPSYLRLQLAAIDRDRVQLQKLTDISRIATRRAVVALRGLCLSYADIGYLLHMTPRRARQIYTSGANGSK